MSPDDFAISGADLGSSRPVRLAVGDIPGEANNPVRTCTSCLHDGPNVLQRPANLLDKIRRKMSGFVPSHLARDEQQLSFHDAIRIAARTQPAFGIDDFHGPALSSSRRRYRCTLPDGLRGSASRNSIVRGYLNGAMSRLTKSWISRARFGVRTCPGLSTMKALTIWPRLASVAATTAHSRMAGCRCTASSTSYPEML